MFSCIVLWQRQTTVSENRQKQPPLTSYKIKLIAFMKYNVIVGGNPAEVLLHIPHALYLTRCRLERLTTLANQFLGENPVILYQGTI